MKGSLILNLKDCLVQEMWDDLETRRKKVLLYKSIKKSLLELDQQKKSFAEPKSPPFDKIAPTESFSSKESKLNELFSREKVLEDKLKKVSGELDYTNGILKEIEKINQEVFEICEYKFFEEHTWYETTKKFYYSRGNLTKKVKKVLYELIS